MNGNAVGFINEPPWRISRRVIRGDPDLATAVELIVDYPRRAGPSQRVSKPSA